MQPRPGGAPRIIPAYAGSTRRRPSLTSGTKDHPRIRGEHTGRNGGRARNVGSSPHTRGALLEKARHTPPQRIIPAYAGSTAPTMRVSTPGPDHPRIRGEHLQLRGGVVVAGGSSPHTRGAPPTCPRRASLSRIIPAYAGSTLGNPCNTKDRRRDYTSFPLPVTHPSGGGGS